MFSIRESYRDRPPNMALLDFPHKKRRPKYAQMGDDMTEEDKFNVTIKDIRIALNKLSLSNYESISN
jgi:hypothetical protein